MICKYLSGSAQHPCCLAYRQLMTPSIYELQTFCHVDPTACLIHQEKEESIPQPAKISVTKDLPQEEFTKAV